LSIDCKLRSRHHWNRSGQGLIEYVLVIALASVALILVLLMFRNQIRNGVDAAEQSLESASGSSYYVPGSASGGSASGSGNSSRGAGGNQGRGRGNGAGGGRGSGQANGN
jgi:hypothetical protein